MSSTLLKNVTASLPKILSNQNFWRALEPPAPKPLNCLDQIPQVSNKHIV